MKTYLALLKGINVGGHKKVPMAALRELFIKSGFKNVQTYIQSGNVILQSSEKNSRNLETQIQAALQNHFGFSVSVFIKTRADLKRIFNACPFSEEKKQASYFALLHDRPHEDLVKIASEKVYENEEYHIVNDCIYFYCAAGYGRAKFSINYFERKLKTIATARNYNTMVKLLDLSN